MKPIVAQQYFAKGGGCFLAGTKIGTPTGDKDIETLVAGDLVLSRNELTGEDETSTIGSVDVLERDYYYIINGVVNVTAEHPFYTERGIVEVKDLHIGDKLLARYGDVVEIETIKVVDGTVTVYNLLDVLPNNNYYAGLFLVHNKGGGGCFLAGTTISTPDAQSGKLIQFFKPGDRVYSFNEETKESEVSVVERLDKLASSDYFIINGEIKATGEHPFYTTSGIKKVKDLRLGDNLLRGGKVEIEILQLEHVYKDVVVYNLVNVVPNHNYFAENFLVHNKGGSSGGRASSSGGKSSSTSSGAKSSSSSGSSTSLAPSGKSTAKAGSKVTVGGKEVQTSTKTPTNKSNTAQKGVVGDNGYSPKFTNGYTPPAGSVVYYNQPSFADYLPWIYIFGHSDAAPANQTATVVQPDGKEVEAKPQPGGTDGLLILNWILLILIAGAIIGGIVWLVNKLTGKKDTPTQRYGW